jgi:D-inositol-3-phosphate glycosyltransferase
VRILLVTAYFRPHVGGVEAFSEILADGVAERGEEVVVVCCRTDGGSAAVERDSYTVRRLPATNVIERRLGVPYPVPTRPEALRLLRDEVQGADVVHVQDALYATSQLAIRLARRRRRPILVTQHVQFVAQRNRALDALQRAAIRLSGPLLRKVDRVVTYNPAVAAWARETWRLDRVDVLPTGVVLAPKAASRAELGLPDDRFLALFVGRDVPKKGLRFVLDAIDDAYDLVVVTDRYLSPVCGLHVRPFMPRSELTRLLQSVDALVLPSVDEGVPLVLQEAAVAGVPIVTCANPGYDAYFDPDDLVIVDRDGASIRAALRRLAADPAMRTSLAESVRGAGARHFDRDAFVDVYLGAYRDLAREA